MELPIRCPQNLPAAYVPIMVDRYGEIRVLYGTGTLEFVDATRVLRVDVDLNRLWADLRLIYQGERGVLGSQEPCPKKDGSWVLEGDLRLTFERGRYNLNYEGAFPSIGSSCDLDGLGFAYKLIKSYTLHLSRKLSSENSTAKFPS